MRAFWLACAFVLFASSAFAQGQCAPRDIVVKALADRHNEAPRAFGVGQNGGVMMLLELFVSPTGSWSIVVVRPDGIACLIAGGSDWQEKAGSSL